MKSVKIFCYPAFKSIINSHFSGNGHILAGNDWKRDQSLLQKNQLCVRSNVRPYSSILKRDKQCAQFDVKPPPKFKPATHVLFGLDGTLLDSEDIMWCAARNYLAKKFKKKYTMDLHGMVMGVRTHEAARIIVRELKLPIPPEVFTHGVWQELMVMLPESIEMPGVKHLVNHFKRCDIPMGVASSSNAASYALKSKNHKDLFKKLCPILLGGSEPKLKKGKPHPDIYNMAAIMFTNIPQNPQKVVVIEDSYNGVRGAKAAGMQVVMVPHKNLPRTLIETAGADLILNTLDDFRPETFDLPPFPA